MERYPHINPKFRHCLSLSDEERITFIRESRWIGYSQAREILQLLEEMLNYPKKPRMPNILLVGESNNGKTTLIHHFYKKHGEAYEDEDLNLVKPILMIESPAIASEKALYMAILNELTAVYQDTASVETLYTQTLHLMRTFGVKMLIIDEFHSMFSGTARKQRDMMNTLKRLSNELQIPIIGVGTENAVNILHTDKQFASRFEVWELPAWEFNEDFLRLMMSFESVLPLKEASNLASPDMARVIFYKSKGNLGNVSRLLERCAVEAIRTKTEKINLKAIEKQQNFMSTIKGLV